MTRFKSNDVSVSGFSSLVLSFVRTAWATEPVTRPFRCANHVGFVACSRVSLSSASTDTAECDMGTASKNSATVDELQPTASSVTGNSEATTFSSC